jgi:hypothetical protein
VPEGVGFGVAVNFTDAANTTGSSKVHDVLGRSHHEEDPLL